MSTKVKNLKQGMVDVSHKNITKRIAVAISQIQMNKKAFQALVRDESPKGNV